MRDHHHLNKLTTRLITKSFPELKRFSITTSFAVCRGFWFTYRQPHKNSYYIDVNKNKFEHTPTPVLIGGLVHELSHITLDRHRRDMILYNRHRRYRYLDERNTDLEVLIRGYGKELIAFMEYCTTKHIPIYEGLSLKELNNIRRNFSK